MIRTCFDRVVYHGRPLLDASPYPFFGYTRWNKRLYNIRRGRWGVFYALSLMFDKNEKALF